MSQNDKYSTVVQFEDALDKAGFGLYSYLVVALSGLVGISFIFVVYAPNFIVPASACEFDTSSVQQGLAIAAPTAGGIVGTAVWGYLADTRGRRSMLLLTLVLSATTNALGSLSVNWIMLMAVQFITVVLGTGSYTMAVTIASESLPLAKRNVAVLLLNSIFLVAQGIMALVAMPIISLSFSYYIPLLGIHWNSWRTLLVVYSVPSLFAATGVWFIQESPKFSFANGDEKQALITLKEIYRVNHGKNAEEFEITGLIKEEVESVSTKSQFLPLFKRPLLKKMLLLNIAYIALYFTAAVIVWLPAIANQFAALVTTGKVSGMTLCDILDSKIEAPADPNAVPCSLNTTGLLIVFGISIFLAIVNTFVSQLTVKIGNRYTAVTVILVTGTAGLLINLVPNAIFSVLLFSLYTVGVIVMGVYIAISLSLFPTRLRAIALSIMISIGYIAGFVLTQLLNYLIKVNCRLGFYLFSSLQIASVLILLLLPDDRPRKGNVNTLLKH